MWSEFQLQPTDEERAWITDSRMSHAELQAQLQRFPPERRRAIGEGRKEYWNSANIILDHETVMSCVEEGVLLSRLPK